MPCWCLGFLEAWAHEIDAAIFATDVSTRRQIVVDKVAEHERLLLDENVTLKGISFREFAVFAFYDHPHTVAHIAQGDATVGFPYDDERVARLHTVGRDMFVAEKEVAGIFGVGLFIALAKGFPIGVAGIAREHVECRLSAHAIACFIFRGISPKTLECGGAKGHMRTVINAHGQKVEVFWRAHLASRHMFHHVA